MRRILEKLQNEMAAFIDGRAHLGFVLSASDGDSAAAQMILGGLDEASSSELYWIIPDDFTDADTYVESCVANFSAKHVALMLTAEKEGIYVPPVPSEVMEKGVLPALERMKALIVFSRSLLPNIEGCSVVWGLMPMQVKNKPAYSVFMTSLWEHDFPFPWCHHVRLIVRDLFPVSLFPTLGTTKRIQSSSIDLSSDSLRKHLEEDISDESLPLEERINDTLILAGMDYSHGNYELSVKQYEIVHRYAVATNNPTLAAVSLNGAGEAHLMIKNSRAAGGYFEAALGAAAQAPGPPISILHNIYVNLGQLRQTQNRLNESEVYYKGAADLGYLLRDEEPRLENWERLGKVQYRQGNATEAIQTWQNGAIVAGRLDRDDYYQSFLGYIRTHYLDRLEKENFQQSKRFVEAAISQWQEESDASTAAEGVGNGLS